MVEATKNDLILLLVKKATENENAEIPGIMGKKALQKCMYFFNEKFDLFSFKWQGFGPHSGEIQQMVQDFVYDKNITIKEIPTRKEGIFIQNMTFNENHISYFDDVKFSKEIDQELNQIIKFANGKKPRELELLASIHYWAKKQLNKLDKYTLEYIHDKLRELKPDAGFTEKDIKASIDTLQYYDYLPESGLSTN